MTRDNRGADRRQRQVRAQRRGLRAEALAALWLRLRGYAIVERDVRSSLGQIDIVARRGRVVAFVEVKQRGETDAAAGALLARQRQRIERAASGYVARRPALAGHDIRFDVVAMSPWRLPRHIVDAWRPESR